MNNEKQNNGVFMKRNINQGSDRREGVGAVRVLNVSLSAIYFTCNSCYVAHYYHLITCGQFEFVNNKIAVKWQEY